MKPLPKVSDDYGMRQQFNTAIAAVMELINEINRHADRSTPATLAVEREAHCNCYSANSSRSAAYLSFTVASH